MNCVLKLVAFRGALLFVVGVLFSVVLELLRVQRQVNFFPAFLRKHQIDSSWWITLLYGATSTIVGLLYPYLDKQFGEKQMMKQEWSSVMRCVAIFVGINHASAKINFSNDIQLSLTLTALSFGLWWLFDRSRGGFVLGSSIAALAFLVCQLHQGIYRYTSPDFSYFKSWLPCIFFSGGVTIGKIGRLLAQQYDPDDVTSPQVTPEALKEHQD